MDLAKSLIRSVARGFYETKQILVIDALMIHSALRDDDLAHLLGMQTKELRKVCAKLEEQRLLAVHNRQEAREGMQRLISRTYYYIDFRQTIDAIKYRFFKMTNEVKGMGQPTEEKKDWFCPRCKSRFTQMEVLDNPGEFGFNCSRCGNPLDREEEDVGDITGTEKSRKLGSQLDPLLKLLQKIDESIVPDNPFETALSHSIPVSRNPNTNPIAPTAPANANANGYQQTVKGMVQTGQQHIEVDLIFDGDKSEADRASEAQKKAALAQQNALPIWHTQSTVTGESTGISKSDQKAATDGASDLPGLKSEVSEDKKPIKADLEMTEEMARYYADLARENELKAQANSESSSGSEGEEDEEEDFEDVPTARTNGTLNGSSLSPAHKAPSLSRIKSEADSESGSSAQADTGTGTSKGTPANTGDELEPPSKKVRIEEPSPAPKIEPAKNSGTKGSEEVDEEDEAEFEDV